MLLIRNAEVEGRLVDVAVDDGRVIAIDAPRAVARVAEEIDAQGGALLPGLHDHHIHLLAAGAARRSVQTGPPMVRTIEDMAAKLGTADADQPRGEWIRGVGYHESVAGPLDRDVLDRLVAGRPVRIQHRSGAMWVLNSPAMEHLGLDQLAHAGVERDRAGRATGRLYGLDEQLRGLWDGPAPDLAGVGAELLDVGITGVTDATPTNRAADVEALSDAVGAGAIPQRVQLTGGLELDPGAAPRLARGPVKLVVADHDLPRIDDLAASIATAHRQGRAVAIHCVTRVALIVAIAAWQDTGVMAGDRIEHGAVVPPDQAAWLAGERITVVTQPSFVFDRGDEYLSEVDSDDLPYLWPCRTLADAGVVLAAGSDAPLGNPDPWAGVAAAVSRRTRDGHQLGRHQRLGPRAALDLYLGPLESPGGPPRRIVTGVEADLMLLDAPMQEILRDPSAEHVVMTFRQGRPHSRRR